MDLSIDELNLEGLALDGARIIKSQFPWIQFTSGRRDMRSQCADMAENICSSRNDKWIAETYRNNEVSQTMQGCVSEYFEEHADSLDTTELSDLLFATLASRFTEDDFARLDFFQHCFGRAWDVQPTTDGNRRGPLIAAIKALPGLDYFTTEEGGLARFHAQFKKVDVQACPLETK